MPQIKHPDYVRQIRGPDDTLFTEVFEARTNSLNGYQDLLWHLESTTPGTQGHVLGQSGWRHHTATGSITDNLNTMRSFSWWRWPNNGEELATRYAAAGKTCLTATRNVVSFVVRMSDGRLQLQQRGYLTPGGKPVGNAGKLSLNGGIMESDDAVTELVREAAEELGIHVRDAHIKVGDVYDAENGRCNHVFRLTRGYDTLLAEQCGIHEAIHHLTNPEGLGRAYLWREDLEACRKADRLTAITVAILAAFKQLLPPDRP